MACNDWSGVSGTLYTIKAGGWDIAATKLSASSMIKKATVGLERPGLAGMCTNGRQRTPKLTTPLIMRRWLYITNNYEKYTYHIDFDETGKGRNLSLSTSDSMQKDQEEEKAGLLVTPRSCDLDIKTERTLTHVLEECLLAVTHMAYRGKCVRGFHIIHWTIGGRGGRTELLVDWIDLSTSVHTFYQGRQI